MEMEDGVAGLADMAGEEVDTEEEEVALGVGEVGGETGALLFEIHISMALGAL